jgi:sugar/nucleoside kinase (ribokinase family)
MVGYVGRDDAGRRMLAFLRERGADTAFVAEVDGHTSQVVLLIEPSGERTIIGIHPDLLSTVVVPVHTISTGDVVYFAAWGDSFVPAMAELTAKGTLVATVPPEVPLTTLPAAIVIGSESQHQTAVGDVDSAYAPLLAQGALRCVVVTKGAAGATALCPSRRIDQPGRSVTPVDQTGAGDAFAAGFLHQMALGGSVEEALRAGTDWGTAAVLAPGSVPPPWSAVADLP